MSSPAVQPILALLAYPVGGNPLQYVVEKAFAHLNLDWRFLSLEVRRKAWPTPCAACGRWVFAAAR